jgi:hypothetical protein
MHRVRWFSAVKKVLPTGATKAKNKETNMPVYKLKHPVTKLWVEIIAESFHEALKKLRQVN